MREFPSFTSLRTLPEAILLRSPLSRKNSTYLFAAFWFIPTQCLCTVAVRSKDIAWTVPWVFPVPPVDREKRHGSEEIFASPSRPVVGQWHLIVFLPALTI